MTALAHAPVDPVERDPRDPELRLEALFDPGTLQLMIERDDSGVLTARGHIEGSPVVAFASDATKSTA